MPDSKIQKKLQSILFHLPDSPGVYRFFNADARVIYVGKAKNLKKRVRSYFTKHGQSTVRMRKLVLQTADIEYTVVDSELEALILETNFIKELRPKFNIMMKDDKNYAYIKVTRGEDFPRVLVVRQVEKDGARYFGPKSSASKAREMLKMLKKLFAYRHCGLGIEYVGGDFRSGAIHSMSLLVGNDKAVKITNKTIKYPCLDYHIKRCIGPCVGKCTPFEYKKIIQNVIDFLEGKEQSLIQELNDQMREAAVRKRFELAAKLRDKILMLENMLSRQRVSDPEARNQDVIHFSVRGSNIFFTLFMIREGKLINQENFIFRASDLSAELETSSEILEAFLQQYYEKAADIPDEILIPDEISDQNIFETWLAKVCSARVKILVPKRGKQNKLLDLALKNAESFAKQSEVKALSDERRTVGACKELAKLLKISELKRIEGYDISHLSGTEIVGSMVVFENGVAKPSDYRRFRIKIAPKKIDDYLDMKEVLGRRLRKLSGVAKDRSLSGDVVFRKGLKKDLKFIEDVLEKEGMDAKGLKAKDFIVGEKRKFGKIGEILRVVQDDKKVAHDDSGKAIHDDRVVTFGRVKGVKIGKDVVGKLASLWVDESERGHHLGQEIVTRLLSKSRFKKIYSVNSEEMEDYYGALGFHVVPQRKIPVIFKKKITKCSCCKGKKVVCMVYRTQKEKKDTSFWRRPDLLLIDGGKGQLHAVRKVFDSYGLLIPVIALAKKEEEIFVPGRAKSLLLPQDSHALQLLQRVRDEAHRFAHAYNEHLRGKRLLS